MSLRPKARGGQLIKTWMDLLILDSVLFIAKSNLLLISGWVVGSLDILGSPTGLVRNIGTGVADLFRMPYAGLTRGPGAFVSGVTHGMGSLVKHISTGTNAECTFLSLFSTCAKHQGFLVLRWNDFCQLPVSELFNTGALTSVTNFATSVSRNMERLSLDEAHRERQEEWRRHKPKGVSDGFKQGLTGFGLSVLGRAVSVTLSCRYFACTIWLFLTQKLFCRSHCWNSRSATTGCHAATDQSTRHFGVKSDGISFRCWERLGRSCHQTHRWCCWVCLTNRYVTLPCVSTHPISSLGLKLLFWYFVFQSIKIPWSVISLCQALDCSMEQDWRTLPQQRYPPVSHNITEFPSTSLKYHE